MTCERCRSEKCDGALLQDQSDFDRPNCHHPERECRHTSDARWCEQDSSIAGWERFDPLCVPERKRVEAIELANLTAPKARSRKVP